MRVLAFYPGEVTGGGAEVSQDCPLGGAERAVSGGSQAAGARPVARQLLHTADPWRRPSGTAAPPWWALQASFPWGPGLVPLGG